MTRIEETGKIDGSAQKKQPLPRWTFTDGGQPPADQPDSTQSQVIDLIILAAPGVTCTIETVLSQVPLVNVLSRLDDPQRALSEIEWRKPAVVLLGISLVDHMDGAITSRIKSASPDCKLIVLGQTEDDLDKLLHVPRVDSYVPSSASASELIEAIVRTAADTNDLSPSMLKLIRMKLNSLNQIPRTEQIQPMGLATVPATDLHLNKPSRNRYRRDRFILSPRALFGWLSLAAALIYALCHVPDTLSALMGNNTSDRPHISFTV